MFTKQKIIKTLLIIIFLIGCFFARTCIEENREEEKKEQEYRQLESKRKKEAIEEEKELENEYKYKEEYNAFLKGKKRCEGYFIKDRREGHWMCFYPASRIESEGNYKDDLKEGEWKSYFDIGENYRWSDTRSNSISRIENYSKGVKSGKYILYHRTNKVCIATYFKNNKMDSIYQEYYPDGKINISGTYKEGKKIGEWKYFSNEGEVTQTMNFK